MFRVRLFIALLACALGPSLMGQSAEAKRLPQERMLFAEMRAVSYQAGGVSLDQAVALVQSKYSARVMRANTVEEDGRMVHYIRLMTADRSRVWTVRVDAATGREF